MNHCFPLLVSLWPNSGVNSLYVCLITITATEKGRDIGDVKGMEQPLKTGKTGRGTANPAPKIVSRLREMRTVTDSFKWHNHAVFSEVYKL